MPIVYAVSGEQFESECQRENEKSFRKITTIF